MVEKGNERGGGGTLVKVGCKRLSDLVCGYKLARLFAGSRGGATHRMRKLLYEVRHSFSPTRRVLVTTLIFFYFSNEQLIALLL